LFVSDSRYFISARPLPSRAGFPESSARTQTRSPLNRMRTQDIRRTIVVATLLAIGSCRGGCRRGAEADRALTVQGRLALFPATARMVAGIDANQLRASAAAAKVQALAAESQADQKDLDEFKRRTGFDPLKQIESLTVAFPES